MTSKQPIPFRGFDERGDVRIYHHGILPHWRQDDCTYFVTFRQADSLPQPVLRRLEHDRSLWLSNHGVDPGDEHWKIQFAKLPRAEQREYEQLVRRKLNEYLDAGHGSCALRRNDVAREVATSLDHFHGERVLTGDFVVMPNHVHVLLRPLPGFELEDILHSIKSFTANKINRLIGSDGFFWQRESYDHIVREFEQLEAFQEYIAANPEKARLTANDCILSSTTYCPEC